MKQLRAFRSVLFLTLVGLVGMPVAPADPVTPRVAALHRDAIVIDTHIDTPQRLLDEGFDLDHRDPLGHVDIPRMKEGGLDAAYFSIWVDMNKYEGPAATARALRLIDAVYEQVRRHPDKLALAITAADIQRAHDEGKIALLLGMEGANPINDDLGLLRMFHRLGIRYLTLTHGKSSNWIDSATDKPKHNGLTGFGQEVIREMNRLGMLVDISHVSEKAFYDTLAATQAPVIASHSSCKALTGIARNLTDDQLRAVAENGGVVQIAMGSWFVVPEYDPATSSDPIKPWRDQRQKEIAEKCGDDANCSSLETLKMNLAYQKRVPRGTLRHIADHIDHVVKVAGIEHVGYGSDFDGVPVLPEGLDDVTFLPQLTQELADRGYSDSDIRKILGGNHLRVLSETEMVAARLQKQ